MDARRHRLARRAGVAAIGALLVGSACGATGGNAARTGAADVETGASTSSAGAVRLARAASTTAAAGTHRFSTVVEVEGADLEMAIRTEGVVDVAARRSSVTVTADPPTPFSRPDGLISEIVVDDGRRFFRAPGLGERAGDGAWIEVDVGSLGELLDLGGSFPEAESDDPSGARALLDLLDELGGDVVEVGEEEVRGVATRRYRAELVLDEIRAARPELEGLTILDGLASRDLAVGPVPVEVWIDDDDRIRRLELRFSGGTGDEAVQLRQTLELWDLDEPVDIEVPEAADVVDFADLVARPSGGAGAGD